MRGNIVEPWDAGGFVLGVGWEVWGAGHGGGGGGGGGVMGWSLGRRLRGIGRTS